MAVVKYEYAEENYRRFQFRTLLIKYRQTIITSLIH